MKTKIFNYDKLKESDITDRVIRVKGILINSKNEILLGEAFDTLQFPGGHLEEGETLLEALKREILEETGIILEKEYEPFFVIKYFLKDYPVIGNHRSIELYYYYIFTDKEFNLNHVYLDDQEKNGNFNLFYVPFKELKKRLKDNRTKQPINKVITTEMLLALKQLKKIKR